MSIIDRAHEAIDQTESNSTNRYILKDAFRFVINIDKLKADPAIIESEASSRIGGSPHLPEGFEWPAGYYFFAQLNLASLNKLDLLKLLPDNGIIYIFFNPGASDYRPASKTAAKVFFANTKHTALRTAPGQEFYGSHPSYYRSIVERSYQLQFMAGFTFAHPVPGELVDILKTSLNLPHFASTDSSIFGAAKTWQDEDEDSLFADASWDWRNGPPPHNDRFLLFQDNFFEGSIHIWINKQKLVLKDFSEITVTVSSP